MVMGLEGGGEGVDAMRITPSLHPLHEAIHHALLAGLVELDAELVAVHRGDVAVAELEVEHAVADREGGSRAARAGDQLAFDDERGMARPWGAFRRSRAWLAGAGPPSGVRRARRILVEVLRHVLLEA